MKIPVCSAGPILFLRIFLFPIQSPGDEVDEPQWLKDFRGKSNSPDSGLEDNHTEENVPGPEDRTPDWLRRIRVHNEQKQAGRDYVSNSPVDQSPESNTDAGQTTPSGDPSSTNPQPVNVSGLQDWLNKLHKLENPKNNPTDTNGIENTDQTMGVAIPGPESGEPDESLWENDRDGSEQILSDSLTVPQDIQKTPAGVDR